jgi:N6-adenosine-specific RNA methylase IME4
MAKAIDINPRISGTDHWFDARPVSLPGDIVLHARGATIGNPTRKEWVDAFAFACAAEDASPWWVIDLNEYLEERAEWKPYREQMVGAATKNLSQQTVYNRLSVGRRVKGVAREKAPSLAHASAVASLDHDSQVEMLEAATTEGWNARELGLQVRARKRKGTIAGQAILEGMYRVWQVDCPWKYNQAQPSKISAQSHYPGMTVDELIALGPKIQAHTMKDAVAFFWVTAPFLYYATDPDKGPDPYRVIRSWGFEPKTGGVWDKVEHNFGHYLSIRHEHLIIATRGRCTPDRPVPMPDSVFTERTPPEHSEKPEEAYRLIERLYDGPRAEMFARKRREGWTCYGNQIDVEVAA